MTHLTELEIYQALSQHQKELANQHMRAWFAEDKQRFERFSLAFNGLLLDYSRNRINTTTIELLCKLAETCDLPTKIAAFFSGQPINTSENRPALHTALRAPSGDTIMVDGQNVLDLIEPVREKMRQIADKVRSGNWRGITGKPIRHIVNIGIGGSHLGPMLGTRALKDFAHPDLSCHFIASVDFEHVQEVFQQIDPESSLFIISSKSFTTLETLTNAKTIYGWLQKKYGPAILAQQFIAITAAPDKALAFGISPEHILPFWNWVGGRYSIWSAIGLPLAIMIGNAHFDAFLTGANQMDQHFRDAPFEKNMPVLMALLSIWYINFFHSKAQAIIPYSNRLRDLVSYLQQAEMESNGKSVDRDGKPLEYTTGPVIFGEEGINGQHAYHQALHQGSLLIPADFILIANHSSDESIEHHHIVLASCLSQASALMRGNTSDEICTNLLATGHSTAQANYLAQHQTIPGNKPSNILVLDALTPKNLGALLALYEHKIFVQGAIWGINSFDQWGVELGKKLLPDILKKINGTSSDELQDAATAGLIQHLKKSKRST